jgi:ADP-ribose pyrophosphatase YjhB (NUDIX family)
MIIASGPVIIEDNKVLLNKDAKDSFWKFCGGRVEEADFNIKNTAAREVKEEMGLEIEFLDKQPYFFYTEKEKDNKKISVILVHFLAKKLNEVTAGDTTTDWKWVDLDKLDEEELAPNITPTLEHFGFINKKDSN